MNIDTINATIKHSNDVFPSDLTFRTCYGTGRYLNAYVDGVVSVCKTRDGECQWFINDYCQSVTVEVLQGDVERIRKLVTDELETYDTKLTWV